MFSNSQIKYLFSRRKRIEEMKALQSKAKYGDVIEITAADYVLEVNKAGEGVWVILHLYKTGYIEVLFFKNYNCNFAP